MGRGETGGQNASRTLSPIFRPTFQMDKYLSTSFVASCLKPVNF